MSSTIGTDLNDADLPKIADQGPAVKQLDSLTYEFLRPNWNPDVCSPNMADRGKGCPASDPAIREAIRWAVNKDEINTRLLGGAAALGFTNVSPNAWFYSDPPTYKFDPEKAKSVLDAAGWVVGADGVRSKNGVKAKIELCTTTRQVRQDTLALVVGVPEGCRHRGDRERGRTRPTSSPTFNEATDQTPCALSKSNYDVAEHAFSVPLDPLANYPSYHSSQFEPNGAQRRLIKDPGRRSDPRRRQGHRRLRVDQGRSWRSCRRSTSRRRSRSRCTSARRSTSSIRRSGTSPATRPRPVRRGTRRLVRRPEAAQN